MSQINLSEYGPILSDKQVGEKVLTLIQDALKNNDVVQLDLAGIKSMATFCSKQIFGKLYVSLGAEVFFDRIKILNASEDIKLLIRIGVQNALEKGI